MDVIAFSSDSISVGKIAEKDLKYLEFKDLNNKEIRFTSSKNEPLLEYKDKLHFIVVEGKISWYQTLFWDAYNMRVLEIDFFVKKDQKEIIRTGILRTTKIKAVNKLIGKDDIKKFFSNDKDLKNNSYTNILDLIVFYNSKYGGSSFVSDKYNFKSVKDKN